MYLSEHVEQRFTVSLQTTCLGEERFGKPPLPERFVMSFAFYKLWARLSGTSKRTPRIMHKVAMVKIIWRLMR